MYDDLVAHYHENVIQPYLAFRSALRSKKLAHSQDLRLAITCASALFHFREHLPKEIGLTRSAAEKNCDDYAVLGDIVNAVKHKSLTGNTPHGAPLVRDAKDVYESINVLMYEDSRGTYTYSYKTVSARLVSGLCIEVIEPITNTVNFWGNYLQSNNVLNQAAFFDFVSKIKSRTRAQCKKEKQLEYGVIRGHRLQIIHHFLKYDKKNNKASPMDMTGWGVEGKIYKPNFLVDVHLDHKESGKTIELTVELTEEESQLLAKCKTNSKKQLLIYTFKSVKEAITNAVSEDKASSVE